MQTIPWASVHEQLAMYREGEIRKVQHEAVIDSVLATQQRFTVYGEELVNVEMFQ